MVLVSGHGHICGLCVHARGTGQDMGLSSYIHQRYWPDTLLRREPLDPEGLLCGRFSRLPGEIIWDTRSGVYHHRSGMGWVFKHAVGAIDKRDKDIKQN